MSQSKVLYRIEKNVDQNTNTEFVSLNEIKWLDSVKEYSVERK